MKITYNDLPLDVEFEFFGAERNAPGTHPHDRIQEHGDYVEVETVTLGDHDITDVLSEYALEDIADIILRRLRYDD